VIDPREEHRLRENIWVQSEDERTSDAEEATKKLMRLLCSDQYEKIDAKEILGGINQKFILKYPQHERAIFKNSIYDALHELAAYQIDVLLGMNVVPMTVGRIIDGEFGSLQYFVENTKAGDRHLGVNKSDQPEDKYQRKREAGIPEFKKIYALLSLDYLIYNVDRKANNWLYLPDSNRVVGIDHGIAFYSIKIETSQTYEHPNNVFEFLKNEPHIRQRWMDVTAEELSASLKPYLNGEELEGVLYRFLWVQDLLKNAAST
jgi:hypothetical protein